MRRAGHWLLVAGGLTLAGAVALFMAGELLWIVASGLAALPLLLWVALCVVIVPAGWWLLFAGRR